MFAAQVPPMSTPVRSTAGALLGTTPVKSKQDSAASTRDCSPSASSSTSSSTMSESGDQSTLAERRGRSVLKLSELVVDFDTENHRSTPSTTSASSLGMTTCKTSTRCTPSTPQFMSFSPPSKTLDGTVTGKSVAEQSSEPMFATRAADSPQFSYAPDHGMTCKGNSQKPVDASQRTPARNRLRALTCAGGDASQRTPAPRKVSLGYAVAGGDAARRSPGSKAENVRKSPKIALNSCESADVSHNGMGGQTSGRMQSDSRSDELKSWLSGVNCKGAKVSDAYLAQQLLAAVPDSYED
mmetsp:Transcript_42343/g.75884  ORF Transcript_42343/g.75884 Transcript_42343/m.75884 type:complete len:297 (-) Transcript_42343:248-1138(-)